MPTLKTITGTVILMLGVGAGVAGGYWSTRPPIARLASSEAPQQETAAERKIIYYRDPSGAPHWSATPTKDESGRDYLPVYEDVSFDPAAKKPPVAATGPRKLLYYRNPMGLADTSPVPKKDWMGMDYIPVYEGEEQDESGTVKVSLEKIQRIGVRTQAAESRVIVRPVRGVGRVEHDESRLTIVTMRSDGYIEDLFVNKTGQHVRVGEPLFRVYSPDIQRAQIDLLVAIGSAQRGAGALLDTKQNVEGALQRLRNLGIPESRIREVRETGANPRTLDWPSPATGDVIEKKVINGQRVQAGQELFRIADHSHVWVIAEIAESDLGMIKPGTRATVSFRAYPAAPVEGEVTFIYPELRMETRTARVRIEVPNPDGRLKVEMYADVVFQTGADQAPVVAVPSSAVIDSGSRQVMLVSKGEGRFEPRPVKLGRYGDGYVEVREGLKEGEEVVTSATFLIDAESNLKAALAGFGQPEAPK